MASTIWRGVREYNESGSNWASRKVLLSGPILVSRAWAMALVAATKAWFRASSSRYREITAAVTFAACAAGRTQVGRAKYWGGSPLARTSTMLVICPGYAFHVMSLATRVRAQLVNVVHKGCAPENRHHCTNRVEFCERSPQGKTKSHTWDWRKTWVGWMNGWMDGSNILLSTIDVLNRGEVIRLSKLELWMVSETRVRNKGERNDRSGGL